MEKLELSLKIEDLKTILILIGILQIGVFIIMLLVLKNSVDERGAGKEITIQNHITINNDEYIDEDEEATENI